MDSISRSLARSELDTTHTYEINRQLSLAAITGSPSDLEQSVFPQIATHSNLRSQQWPTVANRAKEEQRDRSPYRSIERTVDAPYSHVPSSRGTRFLKSSSPSP
ncbi:uncharacterized protein LOC107268113 [Cephus cinctus]|uniref:Uncharacterized protein LOC107268113 n=1 Tax=Cephus cinctus TaxID=211228 RepID=A0AAJ7FKC3_CEPCN|nr:uncharacterized protein LOC107268113 [Cephus cinctus]